MIFDCIVYVFGLLFTALLTYANYDARVKYKQYFYEVNTTQAVLTKKLGLTIGIVSIPIVNVLLFTILFYFNVSTLLGFFVGFTICNAIVDIITLSGFLECYKCDNFKLKITSPCFHCTKRRKATEWNIFSIFVKKKKEVEHR